MKPKVSTIPKRSPSEPFKIVHLRWLLKRGISDRRERERAQAQIEEHERNNR